MKTQGESDEHGGKIAGNDIDRYERLQKAAETQIERVWKAHERHTSLIKWGVGVIVAAGGLFLWKNINDFRADIRDGLTSETRRFEGEMAILTNRVEAKIFEQPRMIETAIEEKFRRENIQPLIESRVQAKVDLVTERIISDSIHKQIDPEMARLTNQIAVLGRELAEAKGSEAEAQRFIELEMDCVAALTDDRWSFDRLLRERDLGTNKYIQTIQKVIGTIAQQDQVRHASPSPTLDFASLGFDPSSATWDDYERLAGKVAYWDLPSVLRALAQQTRFSRLQKLQLYHRLLTGTRA